MLGAKAQQAGHSFAFDSPPLVSPDPVHLQQHFTARLYIDDPLFSVPDTSRLVALCAIADTLIERVQKVPKSAASFDVGILQEIEALCKELAPKKHAQTTLHELGLLDLFPYLAMGLSGEQLQMVQSHPGSQYLNYIGLLNQVVMMGTQLYHDATVPQHHKYAAHQIALLYQCLNMLQGEGQTKPIRRVVERRFDEIKVVTESKDPFLPVELSAWVQEITWLCREEVLRCPPYIHRRVEDMMRAAKGQPLPDAGGGDYAQQ